MKCCEVFDGGGHARWKRICIMSHGGWDLNLYGCSLGDNETPPQKLWFQPRPIRHYVIALFTGKAWKHQPHKPSATDGGSGARWLRQIVDL